MHRLAAALALCVAALGSQPALAQLCSQHRFILTVHDIQDAALGTADTSFLLRAERSGRADGREYTVVYRVTDGNGNTSEATAVVRVPRSQ